VQQTPPVLRALHFRLLILALVAAGLSLGVGAPAIASNPTYTLSYYAGTGASGTPLLGGPATSSPLNGPRSVALDPAGNLYIADSSNERIEKVDATTGIVTGVAGTGAVGKPTFNGPATSSKFSGPNGVTVDSSGNIFVADSGNNRVEKVDATTGTISLVAGTGLSGVPVSGTAATLSKLNGPQAVAVDAAGDVYIAEFNGNRIYRVDASTNVLTVVAGTGVAGPPTPNGLATSSSLHQPAGLGLDSSGNLFIGDSGNNVVERIDATTGILTVVAGTGTAGDPTDGPATASNLRGPAGVDVDASGNLYIADFLNHRVEVVGTDGSLSVIAGTGVLTSSVEGPGTSSPLARPQDVAVDSAGRVLVVEAFGSRVSRLTPVSTSQTITFTGPTSATYGGSAPLSATSTGGLSPVVFTVDGSSGPGVCSVTTTAGTSTVSYTKIGTCVLDANKPASSGYSAAEQVHQSVTVDPAPLTITADNATKVYGGADPAFTATATGAVNGDTITPSCSRAGGENVIGTYAITCTTSDPNYAVTSVDGTLKITAAPVVVTADAQTKVYGDADPTFTSATGGLQGGDTLITPATCSVTGAHSNIGTYPIVCSGADAGTNYSITYQDAVLTVSNAPVIITADNQSKVYGAGDPAFTSSTSGLLGGDTLSAPATCSVSGAHSGVGSYPIACSGADAGSNYSISYTDGSLSVTKAPVIVTAENQTKVYGSADPTFTSSTTGLLGEDGLTTPASCSVSGAHSGVGTYQITCSGADAGGNYSIGYQAGTLTVTAKPITITADSFSIVYGDPAPSFTSSTTGLEPGDALTTPATCGVAGAHTKAAQYPITCTGADAGGNYTIGYLPGTYTVASKAGVVTADPQSVVYGSPDPAFSYTVSGVQPGDALATDPTCTVSGAHTNVGTYPITCSGGDGGSDYSLSYVAGTLTVTKAPAVVTADNQTRPYGSPDPALTSTTTGLLGGDTLTTPATCHVAGAHTNVGDYPIVCSGADAGGNYTVSYQQGTLRVTKAAAVITADNQTRPYGSPDPALTSTTTGLLGGDTLTTPATCTVAGAHANVGDYPIVCSGADAGGNYTVSYQQGTLKVTKAVLVVHATSGTRQFGVANPAFAATITGYLKGDNATAVSGKPTLGTTATKATHPGVYPITATLGTLSAANYTFAFVPGTLRITKAAVTVSTHATTTVHRYRKYPFVHVFSTRVTNATTGAPVPGSVVTIKTGRTTVCKATTNSRGVATCASTKPIPMGWTRNYSASTSTTVDYSSGHATAVIYAFCTHQTQGSAQQFADVREDCLDGQRD
jgi:hypothetical protein